MSDVVEKAEVAATDVFNDTSVSEIETKGRLSDLVDFIEDMIAALPDE